MAYEQNNLAIGSIATVRFTSNYTVLWNEDGVGVISFNSTKGNLPLFVIISIEDGHQHGAFWPNKVCSVLYDGKILWSDYNSIVSL